MQPKDVNTEDDFGQEEPAVETAEPSVEQSVHFYFIAAVRVAYVREDRLKERSVNILLDLMVPYVSQQTLADINRASANRIIEEMGIQINDIQDIVIQGISSLGAMTPEEFRGPTENVTESIPLEPEEKATDTPDSNAAGAATDPAVTEPAQE